jgi:L-seryl-tRNA(Ser) seleniumtransferase
MANLFRNLPATDEVLHVIELSPKFSALPRQEVKRLVNEFLDHCRADIRQGKVTDAAELSMQALEPRIEAFVARNTKTLFRRVLNATGVVIHTNLGRSNLADEAVRAVVEACEDYSNLEFDLETGKRGSRYSHVEELLCRITGAESALMVNNNAAAVFLTLNTLALGKEVIVSRGELVEIGGSFRIPDVMSRSGAKLKEVGATNRTHLADYEDAISEETGVLMKVHASNFRIIGFTKEVTAQELRPLADEHDLPLIEDLGSGNFFNFGVHGMHNEPTVQETVASGIDVVTFSGDKVLGGPQAGVIVGRKKYLDQIKKNPINRAMRIDKMTLAAMEATLRLYLDPEKARQNVPTLAMITMSPGELKKRAAKLKKTLHNELGDLARLAVVPGVSRVGGGSFPEQDISTFLVTLTATDGTSPDALKQRLLATDPPLVGRIEDDVFCLDPRTLRIDTYAMVASSIKQALTN